MQIKIKFTQLIVVGNELHNPNSNGFIRLARWIDVHKLKLIEIAQEFIPHALLVLNAHLNSPK